MMLRIALVSVLLAGALGSRSQSNSKSKAKPSDSNSKSDSNSNSNSKAKSSNSDSKSDSNSKSNSKSDSKSRAKAPSPSKPKSDNSDSKSQEKSTAKAGMQPKKPCTFEWDNKCVQCVGRTLLSDGRQEVTVDVAACAGSASSIDVQNDGAELVSCAARSVAGASKGSKSKSKPKSQSKSKSKSGSKSNSKSKSGSNSKSKSKSKSKSGANSKSGSKSKGHSASRDADVLSRSQSKAKADSKSKSKSNSDSKSNSNSNSNSKSRSNSKSKSRSGTGATAVKQWDEPTKCEDAEGATYVLSGGQAVLTLTVQDGGECDIDVLLSTCDEEGEEGDMQAGEEGAGDEGAMQVDAEGAMQAGTEGAMQVGAEGAMQAGTEGAMQAGAEGAGEEGAMEADAEGDMQAEEEGAGEEGDMQAGTEGAMQAGEEGDMQAGARQGGGASGAGDAQVARVAGQDSGTGGAVAGLAAVGVGYNLCPTCGSEAAVVRTLDPEGGLADEAQEVAVLQQFMPAWTVSGSQYFLYGANLPTAPTRAFFPKQPIQEGSTIQVTCPCNAEGKPCEVILVHYHCPECSRMRNGGLPRTLPGRGWRPGSCGPLISSSAGPAERADGWPMLAFRKLVQSGETESVPLAADVPLEHVGVFVRQCAVDCEQVDPSGATPEECVCETDGCRSGWCPRPVLPALPWASSTPCGVLPGCAPSAL